MSNKLALSYYGRIEYAKLLELKNYMDSNVLNDTNSLSGSYLDKYSPYAVAFGKPIKIANEIDEKMYNLNIHIQAIQQSIYYDE